MLTIFIIGGMGAGKSTAREALAAEGLPCIDLDAIGHFVLTWDVVKSDLVRAFGEDIIDDQGDVDRAALAARAFMTDGQTRLLNRITMPRIEDEFTRQLKRLEEVGCPAVVVEFSVFKSRENSLAEHADVLLGVLAPEEERVRRAVEAGWDEADVRRRLEQQITDEERAAVCDVVFLNDGSPEQLRDDVRDWWREYRRTLEADDADGTRSWCLYESEN